MSGGPVRPLDADPPMVIIFVRRLALTTHLVNRDNLFPRTSNVLHHVIETGLDLAGRSKPAPLAYGPARVQRASLLAFPGGLEDATRVVSGLTLP